MVKFLSEEAQIKLENHKGIAKAPFIVYHAFLLCFIIICLLFHAWIGWWALFIDVIFATLAVFLYGPLDNAVISFYSRLYRGKPVTGLEFADGYKPSVMYRSAFMYGVKFAIVFGASLLLFVPGIVIGCNYALATIIARQNPKMKIMDVLNESNRLMMGHRMEYFGLMMKSAHLYLFGVVTLGIGFIFAMPRTYMCHIVFFRRIIQGDTENLPGSTEQVDMIGESSGDLQQLDNPSLPFEYEDDLKTVTQELEEPKIITKTIKKPILERYDEFDKSPEQLALEAELANLIDDEYMEAPIAEIVVENNDTLTHVDLTQMEEVAIAEETVLFDEEEIKTEEIKTEKISAEENDKTETISAEENDKTETISAEENDKTKENPTEVKPVLSETEEAKKRRDERIQEILARREASKKLENK